MLIKDCMTRHPVMVSPSTSATEAQQLMVENQIRHLPVIGDGKRLKGLITRQRLALKSDELGSLNVWEITRYLADLRVNRIMLKAREVHTTAPQITVERAAAKMCEYHIGCLPVVEDDEIVVGIVTQSDLLRSFQEMLGMPYEGVRLTVRMPNRYGEFVKLIGFLAEQGWGVLGIGTFPERKRPDLYNAVLKIRGVSLEKVRAVIEHIPDQELVDIRTEV